MRKKKKKKKYICRREIECSIVRKYIEEILHPLDTDRLKSRS